METSIQSLIKMYLNIFFSIVACIVLCSCKKSNEVQYDSWANKATETLTNWAITNGMSLQTNNQVSSMVTAFTEAAKSDVSKEISIKTVEAGQSLLQLHENNRLPGVSKDEHGQIDSEVVPVLVSNKLVVVTYPMERTFHIVKDDDTSTNSYLLIKQARDSEWKLQKAWLTDSNGQIIKEWPVQ